MSSFAGDSAWRGLNQFLRRNDQPDAPTLEERIGKKWDEVSEAARDYVEQSGGKACTSTITVKLTVKTYRSENGEVTSRITPAIASKVPEAPLPSKEVYLDHDAVAHTQPTQINMPIMGIRPTAIEGGKNNVKQPGEAGKEKVSL